MIRNIGSQAREKIKETEYTLIQRANSEAILLNNDTGERELWYCNDHAAGYVIEIYGKGYEFVRGL